MAGSSRPAMFISLRVRLVLAFVLVFTPFFVAGAVWLYSGLYTAMLREATTQMVHTAEGAAAGSVADDLQALATEPIDRRADGYPVDERYWNNVRWLAAVHRVEPRAFIYTYHIGATPNELVFITSSGALDTPPVGAKYLEVWKTSLDQTAPNRQGLITTTVQLGLGPSNACPYYTQDCIPRPYTDPWGQWITVFTPIKNAQGQTLAGLGVDFDMRSVAAARQDMINQLLLASVGVYGLVLVLVYLASTLTARPARRLAQAVQQMGQGAPLQKLDADGPFQDEISVLAREIAERKALETALRDSEARYRNMAETMEDVIWTVTPQGKRTYVSPAVERMRGFTAAEVMAQPVAQVFATPEAYAASQARLARRIAALEAGDETARVAMVELEETCKDGSTVMTEVVSKLITDAQGRVVEILGVTRDISERVFMESARRQAEKALQESEAAFRRIFDMAPLGAAVVELDFRFSRVNEAFCQMLGYTAEELVQLTFPQVTHPDDADENRAQVQRLLRGDMVQYNTRKRYIRKDGSVVWGQVWVRAMRNAAGQPLYLLPMIYDLTEQHAAEERYEGLFQRSLEGIFQSSPAGGFNMVNPAMARMFGYASPQEMIDLVGNDIATRVYVDPEASVEFMRWMALEGEVREFDARNYRKDGSIIWTRSHARAVRDAAGAVAYYEGFLEDITDRKAAEDEIRQLNAELEQRVAARTAELLESNVSLTAALRVKNEFLSMMSHELRTPLSNILGLAQLLVTDMYGPLNTRQRGALATLQEAGNQLLDLITDVLDFASASDGALRLEVADVEIGPVVDAAVRAVAPFAGRKRQNVSVDCGTVTLVRADPHRLRQILIHLLNNAVKFTPEHGALGLEVALEGEAPRYEVRFTVWDTGVAVPPADQARIFEPFVQLDSRLARQFNGSGLGLAVARRLAELHSGRLTVESDGVPGHGSRFSLYLPWKLDLLEEMPAA